MPASCKALQWPGDIISSSSQLTDCSRQRCSMDPISWLLAIRWRSGNRFKKLRVRPKRPTLRLTLRDFNCSQFWFPGFVCPVLVAQFWRISRQKMIKLRYFSPGTNNEKRGTKTTNVGRTYISRVKSARPLNFTLFVS